MEQLLAEALVATFPWGIDDHSGVLRRKFEAVEDGLSLPYDEACVLDTADFTISLRPTNSGFANLNPGHLLERFCRGEREEPHATVSIHKVTSTFGGSFCRDVLDEVRQNVGVVLEKLARFKLKGDLSYSLRNNVLRVFDHAFKHVPHEQCAAPLTALFTTRTAGFFAGFRQSCIDRIRRNGALLDVDDLIAATVLQKPDGLRTITVWAIVVRRDL